MTGDVRLADAFEPGSLERVACEWLAAEEEVATPGGNPERAEQLARDLSDQYDDAIRNASLEDLRIAWEAARKVQGDQEMGSEAWASARRLSELLRNEYQVAERDRGPDPG